MFGDVLICRLLKADHTVVCGGAILNQVVASSAGLPVKPGCSLHATVITPDGSNMFIAIFDSLPGGSSCKRSIAKILAAAAFPTFKQIVAAGSLPIAAENVKARGSSGTGSTTVQSQLHQTLLNLDQKILGPDFNLPLEVGRISATSGVSLHVSAKVPSSKVQQIHVCADAGTKVNGLLLQGCLGGDKGMIVTMSCCPKTGSLCTATDSDCSDSCMLDKPSS